MYSFDRKGLSYGKSKREGAPTRKVTYMTPNRLWWVACDIRRLPGGLFRDGVVMRWKGRDWKTITTFHYGIEDDALEFENREAIPHYVIEACVEVGELLAKEYPLRGKTLSPSEGDCLI